MDKVTAITLSLLLLLLFIFSYCCRWYKRRRVLNPPVIISSTHITTTPIVQHPCSIGTTQPIHRPIYPPVLGFSDPTNTFQPVPGQNVFPPPLYNEAILQSVTSVPPVPASIHLYKQPPYNPNY